MSLAPNPNTGEFMLEILLSNPFKGKISVFNVLGRQVWTQAADWPAERHIIPVMLADPAPGLYWVVLEAGGHQGRIGFVVVR
ncbi:MAG: T9SS type A sorting domain-containing protein [Saprospirales bacterium]|nr:T9SS type A sorting domain-containing protein [Saprospirales bacterium]